MVMGPDSWDGRPGGYKILHHAYLEALLGKAHFRMPGAGGMVVSCRSFPTWGVCSRPECRILQPHRRAPRRGLTEFRCGRCRSPLYPARFVVMCEKGHLDDFPWREWAHSESKAECGDPHPVLRLRARGRSTALSDYYVKCDSCGASRSCGRAVSRGGLAGIVDRCSGLSPWLDGAAAAGPCTGGEDGGPAEPHGVQTLSTSLYYPSTVSALYIPRLLHPIQRAIAERKDVVDGLREMNTDREIAERHPMFAELRGRYGAARVEEEIAARYAPKSADGGRLTTASSEMDIRRVEYDDLMAPGEVPASVDLEIADSPLGGEAAGYVSALKKVGRLTEIKVIRSFTRGIAPDPYSTEAASVHFCQIAGRNIEWYPAVENRGEGMLFSLCEERLRAWERAAGVADRCRATIEAVEQWAADHGWSQREELHPRYLLVHTVSHMVARELARRSGYAEASIRERVYCGRGYNAVLLYTASPSSDGSLGGLVRQADPAAFWALFASAVRRARSCSSDPLCADDNPVDKRASSAPVHVRLNGSACYGCALLPETSCENANRLLDRMLAVDEKIGFFSGLE